MTRLMKWLVSILAVSLAINLFLAGFIAARQVAPEQRVVERSIPDFNLRRFAGSLPSEARRDLQQKFRAEREDFRAHYRMIREARNAIHRLLMADEINEDAVQKKIAEIDETEAKMKRRVQELILESLKSLDPDERKKAVERYAKRTGSRHRR